MSGCRVLVSKLSSSHYPRSMKLWQRVIVKRDLANSPGTTSTTAKLKDADSESRDVVLAMAMAHKKAKKLFTPGPLGVNFVTKAAMLRDLGSRDTEFVQTVKDVRAGLLHVAGLPASEFTVVPMQGSGTFSVEAAITSTVPRGGKALIAFTGAYGRRMVDICKYLNIDTVLVESAEDQFVNLELAADILKSDKTITNVFCVHCETSSGVIHPIHELGRLVCQHAPNASYFVDAMSSFGAVPIDFTNVDFLVSSVNKCIEGVPGFGYVICRTSKLLKCKGHSRSLSLDVYDQYTYLEKSGQFRYTPPTHAILAFKKALECLAAEGGPVSRAQRYQENRRIIREGMKKLGFKEFLSDEHNGYIITSFRFPADPRFDFKEFYSRLNDLGQVIYPGKVTHADCFRIGSIGDLHPDDMRHLLVCIEKVLTDMKVAVPVRYN